MGNLQGQHKCYYCGNNIKWESNITQIPGSVHVVRGKSANIIAIGNQDSMTGKETIFEVYVSCSQCGVENKFKETKKSR